MSAEVKFPGPTDGDGCLFGLFHALVMAVVLTSRRVRGSAI